MKPIDVATMTPRLRVLSHEQIKAIHQASVEILAGSGVRVLDEETRTLLQKAGAWTRDNQWVRIPAHLVKKALNTSVGAQN